MDIKELASIKESLLLPNQSCELDNKILEVIDCFKSTNSEIRECSLDIIWKLIESGSLKDADLLGIGDRMIRNMYDHIGDEQSDTVFNRSYSALILGTIISYDEQLSLGCSKKRLPFLNSETFHEWFRYSVNYYENEKDLRGYTGTSGWAHSIAHGGDLLRECAFSRHSTIEDHKEILYIIKNKITSPSKEVYLYNEDNRLARVIVVILLREQLKLSDYQVWIEDIINNMPEKGWIETASDITKNNAWNNTNTFMRALYLVIKLNMKRMEAIPFYEKNIPLREEILPLILNGIKVIDGGLNYMN